MLAVDRLQHLLAQIRTVRIGVLGDFFLDKYLDVDEQLAERSVETGKVAHQVIRQVCSAGAAGTVVNNLAALGVGSIEAIGVIGDDGSGFELRRALDQVRCRHEWLLSDPALMTPTYLKPRNCDVAGLAGEHSRYDSKNRCALSDDMIARMRESLEQAGEQVDAVMVVDQIDSAEGAVMQPAMREVLNVWSQQHPCKTVCIDSRFHIREFGGNPEWGATVLKPNQYEVLGIRFPEPGQMVDEAGLWRAVEELHAQRAAAVICTLGARGVLVCDAGKSQLIPGVSVSGPIDTTGAGDSFSAAMVATLAAGGTATEAATLGILAASQTIQQLGTTGTASPSDIRRQYTKWLASWSKA